MRSQDIGLQLDLEFVAENLRALLLVVAAVYFTNHLLNAVILRFFDCTWKEALMGGAFLAQIGELSFLLGFVAFGTSIIDEYGYQFTLSLISLTLIISPFWIALSKRLLKFEYESL